MQSVIMLCALLAHHTTAPWQPYAHQCQAGWLGWKLQTVVAQAMPLVYRLAVLPSWRYTCCVLTRCASRPVAWTARTTRSSFSGVSTKPSPAFLECTMRNEPLG